MITFARRKDSGRVASRAGPAAVATAAADQQLGGGSTKQLHGFAKAKKSIQTAEAPLGRVQVDQTTLPNLLLSLPGRQQPAAEQGAKAANKEIVRPMDMRCAPSTACKRVPHRRVTPLTRPASPPGSPDSTNGRASSSGDEASSYQPSQEHEADERSPELHHLTVKPPFVPRHGQGKSCRNTSFRAITHQASAPHTDKADDHKAENRGPFKLALQGSQKVQSVCEALEEDAQRAAKRQRTTKRILKEAQIHMPAGTVHASAEPNSLLVEMPAEFDVAGDAGGIGRFALQSGTSSTKLLMDIKGTIYDAKPAHCSSNLLIARVAHTGGTACSATLELVTNAYIQAQAVQTETDQKSCMGDWTDEEDVYHDAQIAKPTKATKPKPKHKARPHKKARATKK